MNSCQVISFDRFLHALILAVTMSVVGCGKPSAVVENLSEPASKEEATPKKPAGLVDKTFDDIKFDIEPDAPYDPSLLTDAIRELDGQRIRIRGYILPTARKRGLQDFVLVRDNQECCFGPGAALFDCILVNMVPDETAEFSVRPVAVEGEFKLSEFKTPDGTTLAIYLIHGEKVE